MELVIVAVVMMAKTLPAYYREYESSWIKSRLQREHESRTQEIVVVTMATEDQIIILSISM